MMMYLCTLTKKLRKLPLLVAVYMETFRAITRQNRRELLDKIAFLRLESILKHAYNNVPFYRESFEAANFHPGSITELRDIRYAPFLTKKQLQDEFQKLLACELPDCHINHTSGSSGQPTMVLQDNKIKITNSAAVCRALLNNGVFLFGERILTCIPYEQNKSKLIRSRIFLQGFHERAVISLEDIKKHLQLIDEIVAWKPTVLMGCPPVLVQLGKYFEHDRVVQPKLLITVDSVLSGSERAFLSNVFRAPVSQWYGAYEVGEIGWECQGGKCFHLNHENILVEIIKDEKPVFEEEGEVVVTSLLNFSLPIIRLRLGDIGKLSYNRCICGLELPRLYDFEGRLADMIVLRNGKKINPAYFIGPRGFLNSNIFYQFQVVQEKIDLILIKYVRSRHFSQDVLDGIRQKVDELFENKITVIWKAVERIPPNSNGKWQVVKGFRQSQY